MKKIHFLLPMLAMFIGFTSCGSDDDEDVVIRHDVTVNVKLPSDVASFSDVTSMALTVFNTATSQESVAQVTDGKATVTVAPGTYNFTVSGETSALNLNGVKTGVDVFSDVTVEIDLIASVGSSIIFKEVYFSGVPDYYFQDAFYEIYNNTDEVQYLDGIIMGVVDFGLAVGTYLKDQPSIWMTDGVYTNGKYPLTSHVQCFPGTGTDFPIQPRSSIIVASNPINHSARELAEGDVKSSVNLENAGWQLFDDNSFPADTRVDGIPNMTLIWKNWGREMMPATEGQAIVLARLKNGQSPVDYAADPSSVAPVPGGTTNCFVIPADCIIDAIDIVPADAACHFKHIEAKDDAGMIWYTNADGVSNGDYSGKSLRRKVIGFTADGKAILKDTNNSSNDFIVGGGTPTPGVFPSVAD